MSKNKDLFFQARGTIEERLKNNLFKVLCDNGEIITADIASRFRTAQGRRRAKIVEGNRVIVEISLKDLKKGQIVSLIVKKSTESLT